MAGNHIDETGDHHFKQEEAALSAHKEGLSQAYVMVFQVGRNADDGPAIVAVCHHDGEGFLFSFMAHGDGDDTGVQGFCDFSDVRPCIYFLAGHGEDGIPLLYALLFCRGAGEDAAYDGKVRECLIACVEKGASKDEKGKKHIKNGACRNDNESGPDGTVHEGPGVIVFITAVHSGDAVESSQGDSSKGIKGFSPFYTAQFRSKAYGKFFYFHAGEFGHQEMAAFIDEDDHCNNKDGSQNID